MDTLISLIPALTVATIVGCGLMAGLFFVFSVSVMKALSQMPPSAGMRAMQLINRTILNPVFLGAFLLTALFCLGLAIFALWGQTPGRGWLLAGAGVYLLGGFAVTATRNVPLNEALDRESPGTEEGDRLWRRYLERWTRWNHLRTVACIAATVMLGTALVAV